MTDHILLIDEGNLRRFSTDIDIFSGTVAVLDSSSDIGIAVVQCGNKTVFIDTDRRII